MKTVDFLSEHSTCHEDAEWALSVSSDMSAAWDALVDQGKHEWLMWIATRPGVFPESTLRRLACRFVRETPLRDERTVWDLLMDGRSRKAIEVTEAYVDGNATEAELSAASAAAYAAYDAARADADADADHVSAYYAAYAAASCDAEAVWTAADAAADAAARAARAAANADFAVASYDARADAYDAQVQMIAELGNPFKKEPINENR